MRIGAPSYSSNPEIIFSFSMDNNDGYYYLISCSCFYIDSMTKHVYFGKVICRIKFTESGTNGMVTYSNYPGTPWSL